MTADTLTRTAPPSEFVTATAVAYLIGYSTAQTFRRHLPRLRKMGFPDPLPTSQRPVKWRRSAVLAWLEEVALPPEAQGGNVIPMRRGRG